jgi:hypothetical protein
MTEEEKLKRTTCVGKAKHLTRAAAEHQKNKGKRTRKTMPKGFTIKAYKCQFCNFYHVGNSKT